MGDRRLRWIERRYQETRSWGDADVLIRERARAGMFARPDLVPALLERGTAPIECWGAVGQVGDGRDDPRADLLIPIPCSGVTSPEDGSPGAYYAYRLQPGHPYVGYAIAAVIFHDGRSHRVLSHKACSPISLHSNYEVCFRWKITVGDGWQDG